jgi:DNA uptake protein ComE-like DNA-binding protein
MPIFISPEGVSYLSQRPDRPDLIRDGFRLYVDAVDVGSEPVTEPGKADSDSGSDTDKININTASVDEMVSGLGLSIAKAKAIEQSRPYADISELVKAKGVDIAAIADKVVV